jgi:hypothetical protein
MFRAAALVPSDESPANTQARIEYFIAPPEAPYVYEDFNASLIALCDTLFHCTVWVGEGHIRDVVAERGIGL